MPPAKDNSPVNTEPKRLQSLLVRDGGLEMSPSKDDVPAFLLEANALVRSGRVEEARLLLQDLRAVEQRVAQDPSRTDLMYITARLLLDTGLTAPAEAWLKRVAEAEPHPQVFLDLAQLASNAGCPSEAARYSGRAVELDPECGSAVMGHGLDLIGAGRIEEGVLQLERAVRLAPANPLAGPMWLWHLHYLPGPTRAWFSRQYRAWARIFVPLSPSVRPFDNDPDPDRRIRVGYLSPYFYNHAVMRAFGSFLEGIDHEAIEVTVYGAVTVPDPTTDRMRAKCDVYRSVGGLGPESIAELIREDRIDILVTVGGHVTGNCEGVLALKPAPLLVDYGGIDTSGMEQIDYRLTDEILDPPQTQCYYPERFVYLPGGLASYVPPAVSPLVEPLPARQNGFVTFGSFNNHTKLTPQVLSLWARILQATGPRSRMIIKCHGGSDRGVREGLWRGLEDRKIARNRIEIHGMLPHGDYLALCGRVDLALDAYPYNGCITTLEGLWMGVPIVSLSGELYISRVSLSLLSRLGLEVFVASTPEEYVAKAVAYAGQWDALEAIRRSLRDRLLQSSLCSPARLGRELAQAYRGMWRQWCEDRIQDQQPVLILADGSNMKMKNEEMGR